MMPSSSFLTIDTGGTYLKSAVMTDEGKIVPGSALTVPSFSSGSRNEILSAFEKVVCHGIQSIRNAGTYLSGIGIAFPGPFDYDHGISRMEHKFMNIRDLNLKDIFCAIPGVPSCTPVQFIHDANAVLQGELWKGNAMKYPNSAVITLGTGLGFAFSKNGIIQTNATGGPLLTIYKIPFGDGILEDYTARRGFISIYGRLSGKNTDNIDVADIAGMAEKEDIFCIGTFNEVAGNIATALKELLRQNDINCLLFGGQISRSFHLMEKVLREKLKEVKCLRKINSVKNINDAPLLGALKAVKNYIALKDNQELI